MSSWDAAQKDELFESLLGDFLDESGELLQRLNDNLLELDEHVRNLEAEEQQVDVEADLLNEMFRAAHSLKGLSAMLGLDQINSLTHRIENVFDAARRNELALTPDVVELVFQAVDRVAALVELLRDPEGEPVDCEPIIESIQKVLRAAGAERQHLTGAAAQKAAEAAAAEGHAESADGSEPEQVSQAEPPAGQVEQVEEATPEPAADSARQPAADQPPASPADANNETGSSPAAEPQEDPFEGIEDEAEIDGKYLTIFIDEAELTLDQFCETLLACEERAETHAVESLMVTAHRIKGSAASVGLNRAARFSHLMEDLLQSYLDSQESIPPELVDIFLQCVDSLRRYIAALRRGENPSHELAAAASQLCRFAARRSQGPDSPPAAHSAETHSVESSTAASDCPPLDRAGRPEENPQAEASSSDSSGEQECQSSEEPSSAAQPVIDDALREQVRAACGEASQGFLGVVSLQPGLPLAGLKAGLLYERLSHAGEIRFFDPPKEQLEELLELDQIRFGIVTEQPAAVIRRQLEAGGVDKIVIEAFGAAEGSQSEPEEQTQPAEAGSPSPSAEKPAPEAATASPQAAKSNGRQAAQPARRTAPANSADTTARPNETLRVDIGRLDRLMNLAGELVINRAQLTQVSQRIKRAIEGKRAIQSLGNTLQMFDAVAAATTRIAENAAHGSDLAALGGQVQRIRNELEELHSELSSLLQIRGTVNELAASLHQLDRITDGIQQSVMETRMVPIGPLFARFRRVVRDITRANGKIIRLVIQGEKTELDKRMIDELGDPLIHMVRNAADHGIEAPDVREAAGKPREGTVTLSALHRGNSIVIQVSDDGQGLDAARILRKAINKGLVSEAEADRLTPREIYQLIWEPGLSTAEKVTQVSGRGMGMDIVKSKIEEINGTLELDSVPGKGTTVTIKLPLTLAILPSLMVSIGDEIFAIPLEAVDEIVRVGPQDLASVHGIWTATVRDRIVSVVQLSDVFNCNCGPHFRGLPHLSAGEEIVVVILSEHGRKVALVVDRVLGEEDVVIKSLAENFKNVPGIAGASILGDGRVSLILDVATLAEMVSRSTSTAAVT